MDDNEYEMEWRGGFVAGCIAGSVVTLLCVTIVWML